MTQHPVSEWWLHEASLCRRLVHVCVCVCVYREGGERERRGRCLPVETMLLISQWVLTQMEAFKEGQRVYYAFLDYSIYSLFWGFAWLCSSYVSLVTLRCSWGAIQSEAIQEPQKSKEWGFCSGQHRYSAKGRKFWDEIPLCLLPHATQELPWFMAKPIGLNLRLGWCNARRDVRADAAVKKSHSLPDMCCIQRGKFRRQRVCSRALSSEQHQHIFQLLWDKELVETVMDGFCSNILLHFLLLHHSRVNQFGMVQRWNQSKLLVLAHHSAIFSTLSLTWKWLFSKQCSGNTGLIKHFLDLI